MSAKATFWAWEQRGLSSSQKLVLLCLADNHNGDSGQCNPSVAFVADKTGLNRKTILQAMADLESLGLIVGQKRLGSTTNFRLKTSTYLGIGKNGDKPKEPAAQPTQTEPENGTGPEREIPQKPVPKTAPVPEAVPVPKTDITSTSFTNDQYQKRDTEPKTESTKNLKPSESAREDGKKFPMFLDWEPVRDAWAANCIRAGVNPDYAELIHEFRLYWSGENIAFTEHQWQGKLINRIKSSYQKTRIVQATKANDVRDRSLAEDLHDRSWAAGYGR